ncbi:hypothetical protein CAL7716_085590 [Calothrix sp. PCC 7716]|nr:hypothetical protein CAL7716_085590 [Calothrix sp. PCC 7716]
MSLKIALYDGEQEIISMNWTRNPFGLCRWAEDNFGFDNHLWHVCNEWSYNKAHYIDRALFQQVVHSYYKRLHGHLDFYFYFNNTQFNQFIRNYLDYFPLSSNGIVGSVVQPDRRLAIPMHHFDEEMPEMLQIRRRKEITVCQQYRAWFGELMHFADLLQNANYSFYCSN